MISAVDTNILLDIFLPDPKFGEGSLALLERAYKQGALVICPIVYAELVPQFADRAMLDETLRRIGIEIRPLDLDCAFLAGQKWSEYRRNVKKRDRIITDFLIGAFAKLRSDQFLTRDRGFYRTFFAGIKIAESGA